MKQGSLKKISEQLASYLHLAQMISPLKLCTEYKFMRCFELKFKDINLHNQNTYLGNAMENISHRIFISPNTPGQKKHSLLYMINSGQIV